MAGRRTLTFASMDEVMPEVDRLLAGHTIVGKWSLGQTCFHLTKAIAGSLEGTSIKAPWLIRRTVGPIVIRRILRAGKMPSGLPTAKDYQPATGLDDRAEAEALRAAIRLFGQNSGEFAEHPFFGRISGDQWRRLHALHCAHHLSFALPVGGA